MSMCRYLERGGAVGDAVRFLNSIGRDFPWIPPPSHLGDITVHDVLAGQASQLQWAVAVWRAWSVEHPRIHAWVDEVARTSPAAGRPA